MIERLLSPFLETCKTKVFCFFLIKVNPNQVGKFFKKKKVLTWKAFGSKFKDKGLSSINVSFWFEKDWTNITSLLCFLFFTHINSDSPERTIWKFIRFFLFTLLFLIFLISIKNCMHLEHQSLYYYYEFSIWSKSKHWIAALSLQ